MPVVQDHYLCRRCTHVRTSIICQSTHVRTYEYSSIHQTIVYVVNREQRTIPAALYVCVCVFWTSRGIKLHSTTEQYSSPDRTNVYYESLTHCVSRHSKFVTRGKNGAFFRFSTFFFWPPHQMPFFHSRDTRFPVLYPVS